MFICVILRSLVCREFLAEIFSRPFFNANDGGLELLDPFVYRAQFGVEHVIRYEKREASEIEQNERIGAEGSSYPNRHVNQRRNAELF
jgi:hypothetical protein